MTDSPDNGSVRDERPAAQAGSDTASAKPIVSVEGLTVSFNGTDVTHGVSFDLYPGRITALVGESGSGKSVSSMALPRLDPSIASVRGRAVLSEDASGSSENGAGDAGGAGGIDLLGEHAPLRRIRGGLIGTVFQEPSTAFNPVFTVGEQVAESLKYHGGKLSKAERKTRVLAQFREVGLLEAERVWKSYPHELSGGQLQRAMIAMAIINRPKVLIADEPTTALDVTTQQGILNLIGTLARDLKLAVLLITHDMGVVWQVAQYVYVMHDGVVVEHGEVGELFRHPKDDYTRMLLAAVPKLSTRAADAFGVVSKAAANSRADGLDAADPKPEEDFAGTRQDAPVIAELKDVAVRYHGGGDAVKDVSFTIRAGQTRALVGESGAGKTTIAKALSGQLEVSSGAIDVEGHDLATLRGKAKRAALSHIGYVFQDSGSALNPRKTVGWSIAEPMMVQGGFSLASQRERVAELLNQVKLPGNLADRFPHELSGGQRQRVGIARALALKPTLLIADEPTSSLDVTVQSRVLDLFGQLQEEYRFACLFITHDLGLVQRVADVVTVLRHGRIVESGVTDQVLNHPLAEYTRTLLDASPKIDL